MSSEPPQILDTKRLNRSILAARLLVIFLIILPLLPFVYVAIVSGQIAASPDQGAARPQRIETQRSLPHLRSTRFLPS